MSSYTVTLEGRQTPGQLDGVVKREAGRQFTIDTDKLIDAIIKGELFTVVSDYPLTRVFHIPVRCVYDN